MGEVRARITYLLYAIRRAWRRRVDLQGAQPYDWRRIVRRARLGSTAKLVAYVLADYASADGRNVRPGNERVAAEAELSDKSVRRAMKTLRDIGLIERTFEGSKKGRRALADEYRLTIPADLEARIPLLHPELLEVAESGMPDGSPVTGTGVRDGEPVDNPGTPVTQTGVPGPGTSGSPVTESRTPVTESKNTGHSDRPCNQAPNHQLTKNTRADLDRGLSWKGASAHATEQDRDDLASDDEAMQFRGAHAILGRVNARDRDDLMAEALAEMDNPNNRQLVIRAAQILARGIPA